MAPRKTERILNLTICLLVTRQFLPKSRIRQVVEGYHDLSDAAFERTFERDKDELRDLGIPIQVGSYDPLFDDEPGYRIERSDFELPSVDLTAQEAAVVGVAARAWHHTGVAATTTSALAKLRAAGVEPDVSHFATLEPSVAANEAAFEPLWNAVIDRRRVAFTYRDGSRRTLEPWGITSHHGRWYVVGRDVDRAATRMFKLSRISDVPTAVSRREAYDVPGDLDLRALARSLAPVEPTSTAVVGVRVGKAPTLSRRGVPVVPTPGQFPVPAGFGLVRVGYADTVTLVEELARFGADVVVVEPASVRERVIEHFRTVLTTDDDLVPDDADQVAS
ncbi:MAG: helix-turn-helix transcriptional regulator [Propionibacteriaceae bacterium]